MPAPDTICSSLPFGKCMTMATPNTSSGLRIGFPYAGDRFGGSNVSSLTLARALLDRGHVPIALTHGDGRAADEARARGLLVEVLPPLSSKAGYMRSDRARFEHIHALPTVFAAILRNRLDIVHVNDLGMLRTWALPTLVCRRAFVAHWRTALAPSRSVALALRCAAAIVAISDRSRSVLPDWARQKAVVEYNPIETYVAAARRKELKAAIRAELGLPDNAVLLGVFGTLIRRKRSYVLAEILGSISSTPDGRPVFGIVCGERAEPLDELLFKKIAAFDLGSRIRMVGFVRPVENWMAACDLVLAPAVDEAFGRTPLEAFASGTLALVSSDCGAAELIREDRETIVLPPVPVEAWVQSVATLLADGSRMAAIAERASGAVTRLSASQHAGRIEAIYHQLAMTRQMRGGAAIGQRYRHQRP
jgi:glycosyltransferase involved in cell wall biosynthesis